MDTHDNTTQNNSFFYLSVMLGIVILLIGYYTYTQVSGNTLFGVTITTNPDLEDGLVGHYTFDGPDIDWSSTTAEILDRSGNGNGGDATNLSSQAVALGTIGQALSFDGSDESVEYATNFGLDDTAISIATWVYLDSTSKSGAFVKIGKNTTGNAGYGIGVGNSTYDDDGNDLVLLFEHVRWIDTNTTIGTGWHHVAMVIDGSGTPEAFIDGQSVGTFSGSGPQAPSSEAHIGGYISSTPSNRYVDVTLDDVRLYDRALSAAEVQRLYELGATTRVAKTITTNPSLEDGLISHYTFDGKYIDWSSSTAEILDRSSQGNNGNVVGFDSSSVALGTIGQALSFDGSDDSINAGSDSIFDFGNSGSFTAAAWFYDDPASGQTDWRNIVSKKEGGGSIAGWSLRLNSGDSFETILGDGSSTVFCTIATHNPISEGRWYHGAVTVDRDADSVTVYLNGGRWTESCTPPSGSLTSSGDLFVGTWDNPGNPDLWWGMIDDVRLYDRALSAAEVQRLYELGATTRVAKTITTNSSLEDGLVGHYTFDGPDIDWSSTTAEILDRSVSAYHGDATGLTNTSVYLGPLGQGLNFDSSDDYISVPSFNISSGELSISAWVYLRSFGSGADQDLIIRKGNSIGATDAAWGLDIDDQTLRFVPRDTSGTSDCSSGGGANCIISDSMLSTNTWYHVAGTYNGTTMTVYVNGTADGSKSSAAGVANSSNDIVIGARSDNSDTLDGYLDDVRIYNRALSSEEVQRLYELGT